MTELKRLVGDGTIESSVRVNQIYARRQHQGTHLNHPAGGEALFLRKALMSTHREHLARVAMTIFRGNVQAEFIRYAERMATESKRRTPVELDNLRQSDSTKVKVQGRIIYNRPAKQKRLSRTALNKRVRAPRNQRQQEGWWQ